MADQDDKKLAKTETEAAAADEQLSSTNGSGVHASDRNSAQAAEAVESISKPTGTVAPDASASSEHTAEAQLKNADDHADEGAEKHYPQDEEN